MLRSSLKVKTPLRLPNGVHIRRRVCRVRTRSYTAKKWDVAKHGPADAENVKAFYDKNGYHTASPTFSQAFSTGYHHHNKDLHMVGIAGEYVVQVDGKTIKMGPGDVVSTPKDVEHEEHVTGQVETTVVYATKEDGVLDIFQNPPPSS